MKKTIVRLFAVAVAVCLCSLSVAAMQLFINTYTGQLAVDIEPDAEIAEIKAEIEKQIGVAPENQELYYKGNLLNDDWHIYDYSIGAEDEMDLEFVDTEIGGSVGSVGVDVNGNFVEGEQSATVYKVDIAWGSMEFTYTAAFEGTWNPDTHSFDGAVPAAWTNEAGANVISLTNHSNAEVMVAFSAVMEAGIEYSFNGADGAVSDSLVLPTAVGTTVEAAPAADVYFNIIGGEVSHTGKIGTITVTLS